jgi:hypothetical protein
MAYLSIGDFRYGMDRRRERVAGTPGTLWTLENGHITRGGDIEGVKKFVPTFDLPDGTFGCFSLNKQLYVFGSGDLASSMPLKVRYQRLQSPNGGAMTALVDVKGFAGKVYAIADFDDGGTFHFLDGARIEDWDTIAAAGANYDTLAHLLAQRIGANDAVTAVATGPVITIEAKTPGTAFTISASAVDSGSDTDDQTATVATPQANVAAVAEVRATVDITVAGGASGTVDSVTINGVELLQRAVQWNATNAATATRLAQQINNSASTTGYSAAANDAVVTVSAAPGTGATPNGRAVAISTSGTIDVSAAATLAGGVTAVDAVAQISTVTLAGTFDVDDLFTVTVNGTDYVATGLASGTGRSLYVDWQRVWSPVASLWRYCSLTDATIWDPSDTTDGHDAGFINVAQDAEGAQTIICAARYQNYAAVYCETCVVLYTLDTDPSNFAKYMVLDNTNTESPKSAIRYGNNDVFHLDPTGVRSLRALNASNAPYISDVGNAIDTFVLEFLDTLTEAERRDAVATIEPRDGRYWLAVGERIFVLSYFPGAKISAWSYYSPGFAVTDFTRVGRQLYARAGSTIYLYGGADAQTYPGDDEMVTLVELPFLSAGTPATRKGLTGFDAALTNEWKVEVLGDPNREDKTVGVGTIDKSTYAQGDDNLPGQAQLVAFKMTCRRRGRRTFSMAQIHYQKQDAA